MRTVEEQIAYSRRIRAGKRTYFIDVKSTRADDYYVTITESKRKYRRRGDYYFEKHKIFLYKEDFNKFLEGISEAIHHVKTELMPEYDFTAFDREDEYADDAQFHDEQEEGYIEEFEEEAPRIRWD